VAIRPPQRAFTHDDGPVGHSGDSGASQTGPIVFGRRRQPPVAGQATTWVSALNRFARSVHRFHDRVEVIMDRRLRHDLQQVGAQLEEVLDSIRTQVRSSPDHREETIPTVRGLLRSGTLCAHATECAAAAAAASRARNADETASHLADVKTVVAALVAELLADCRPLPEEHQAPHPAQRSIDT
jgi:hypothetical protein